MVSLPRIPGNRLHAMPAYAVHNLLHLHCSLAPLLACSHPRLACLPEVLILILLNWMSTMHSRRLSRTHNASCSLATDPSRDLPSPAPQCCCRVACTHLVRHAYVGRLVVAGRCLVARAASKTVSSKSPSPPNTHRALICPGPSSPATHRFCRGAHPCLVGAGRRFILIAWRCLLVLCAGRWLVVAGGGLRGNQRRRGVLQGQQDAADLHGQGGCVRVRESKRWS